MTEQTVVRVATAADEEGLMGLCRLLHAENGPHAINEDKVRAVLRRCIALDNGIIGVIGPPDDLKGCVCILVDYIWFSNEMQLLEIFNFVRADCRKSDYARSLIKYAKRSADETGCDLMIGIISNIRTEAKIRLYERLLPKAGAFFCYRPPRADEDQIAAE